MDTQTSHLQNKLLIGLAGKKLVGKSTIANMLSNISKQHNFNVCAFSFGDALKQEVSSVYGFDVSLCYSQEGKLSEVTFTMDIDDKRVPKTSDCIHHEDNTHTTTVRRLLQWYGTEYARKLNPNYWVDKTKDALLQLFESYNLIILDDVRFLNEVKMVQSFPRHYVCKVLPYKQYNIVDTHPSETELDHVIDEFDNIVSPKYGIFHLKLVANKLFSNVIVPFFNSNSK